MVKPRSALCGVSLMEVLLALVLISFGLFGIVDLYMNQAKHVARTQQQVQAASLAQSYLAQLQAAGYQAVEEKIRTHADAANPDLASLFPRPTGSTLNSDFEWNAYLRRVATDDPKRIEITIVVQRASPASKAAGQDEAGPSAQREGVRREVRGYVFAP
jgi:Tfp pilus assembly protein PilV